MKNFNFYQKKNVNNRKAILLLCLLSVFAFSSLGIAQVTTVNTLTELFPYLDDDSVNVKLAPGTYTISASDITNGTFSDYTNINDNKAYVLLLFQGNNSTYDFTDVKINVLTEVFNAIPSDAGDFFEVQVIGNNNVLKNLTLEDVGSVYDYPKYGCLNVVMDGKENRIEGFHITTRGSTPYGYGDCFGKGSTYTIQHWKHSAFLVRGNYNHALNDTIFHYSYGHCMFMQAASHPTIEGCYLEGEMRTTDDMLLEEGTGTAADLIDFYTVWGYRLPSGYTKSTGEAGIRAYNAGNTTIDGVDYSRGTDNPTILNCYVKNLRVGVTLTHATGTKYVEGVTTIGTERGFAIGSGDIVDCYADAQYGPVFGVDYESDKNCNAEITVLPYEGESYNGSKYLAYIRGSNHNITFKSAVDNPDQDLKIEFGGDSRTIGQLAEIENYAVNNVVLNNYTNYPVILNEISYNNTGVSGGMITDFGTNNSFSHTAVSSGRYEAEDFSVANGVTSEMTTDDGAGENVTSIESGDYVSYEINVPHSGTYTIDYRVASALVDGDFSVSIAGQALETVSFTATGGDQVWTTVSSSTPVELTKGTQTLTLTANTSGWKLNWFDLKLECAKMEIVPYVEIYNSIGKLINTQEALDLEIFSGNTASLQPGPAIGGSWSWTGPNGFTADSRIITIETVGTDDVGEYLATISNDCGQQSTVTFNISLAGTLLIEAESYSDSDGVTTETTTDVNGGDNLTSIEANDWMTYSVNITVPALYAIDYRVASESVDGDLTLNVDGEDVEQFTFTATSGAQSWLTKRSSELVYLTEGTHTLKITANNADWQINWFELVGQDYVSPCLLPFEQDTLTIQNEVLSWTTGLMDITCASSVNVYVEMSETGILTATDSLNIYYKLNNGDLVEISKSTGSLSETLSIIRELNGTTLEIIVEGASASDKNYYTIDKISIVESTDPFAKIEAEDYNEMEGVNNSGTRLGSIQPGDWSMYAGLDLTGVISIDASVGTVYSDAYIEVRLEAIDGLLIGTIEVPNTGNYNTYSTGSTYIEEVTGIYDVYLVYQTESSANVCNIDWFQFSDVFIKRPTDPYERFEAEINDEQSGTAVTTTSDVDGDEEVSDLQEDDYIMFSDINIENAISIEARVASAVGGVIEVRVGSATKGDIIAFIDVPNTGDTTTWQTVSTSVDFVEGDNDIYFVFKGDGDDLFRLNWLKFSDGSDSFPRLEVEDYTTAIDDIRTPSATDDEADNGTGEVIKLIKPGYWLHFSDVDLSNAKSIRTRFATNKEDASVEVRIDALDGELIGIIDLYDTESWANWKTSKANISDVTGIHDVYFVYQTESSTYACYSNWFQFSEFEVAENIDMLSRIEAENYNRASGTAIAATFDVDGEEELTIVQNEDWILFKNINLTDITNVDIRYATSNECKIYMRYGSYDGSYLGLLTLPSTDTNWQTLNASLLSTVPDGLHDVYLVFKGSPDDLFKLNWIQFYPETSAISNNVIKSDIELYPNPVSNELVIENATGATVELYNMLGCVISISSIRSTKQTIDLSAQTEGYYLVKATKIDGTVETFKVIKE